MAAEEDDEDIWDSWEDMADSGELERRMEEREKQVREKDEKASTAEQYILQETKRSSPVMMKEDTNRTLYKPQLKILKRPDSGGTNSSNNQETTKSKPVHKTLAERQAQYAEARARILGSPSDESNDPEKSEMPKVIQVEQKLPESVIRLPRGPDENGSKGFQVVR